jgi:iron-sulfur cluster assembly accessory protein
MIRSVLRIGRPLAQYRGFSSLPDIVLSKAASSRILALRSKTPGVQLRLAVEGGGCSGFQYNFALEPESEREEGDRVFERDGAAFVVDEGSLEFVKGSTIDFSETMVRSSFVVANNPLSESACGCGSSFAVKNFASNPALD